MALVCLLEDCCGYRNAAMTGDCENGDENTAPFARCENKSAFRRHSCGPETHAWKEQVLLCCEFGGGDCSVPQSQTFLHFRVSSPFFCITVYFSESNE
uniref:Uncharacterized protein n=1 Tax=Anguilla anguilla TaxID=7936 RepID=A0A0E9WW56_ANGAN